jgi:hypothetical protein
VIPPKWKFGYKVVEAVRTGHYRSIVGDLRYQLNQVAAAEYRCGPLAIFDNLPDAASYVYYVPTITGLRNTLVTQCAFAPYRGPRAVWNWSYQEHFPAHESWAGTCYSRKALPLRVITPREIVRAIVQPLYAAVHLSERVALTAQRYVDTYRTFCTLEEGWAPPYDSATGQIDCNVERLRAIFDAEDVAALDAAALDAELDRQPKTNKRTKK